MKLLPFQKITILLTKHHFSSYKIAAVSKLNIRFIEDMHFNVEKYLTNEFARRFGRAEEQVFINGTGVNEPSGHFNDRRNRMFY